MSTGSRWSLSSVNGFAISAVQPASRLQLSVNLPFRFRFVPNIGSVHHGRFRQHLSVPLVDRRNFHLFQPLLCQVATVGLSPANIAAPLRSVLKRQKNARVLLAEVCDFELAHRRVILGDGVLDYDTLVVATGASHHYFGNDHWELLAPGLKTIEDATEIRRRIFLAFEAAERAERPEKNQELLTFVVVGGGPTGVELAGATTAEIAAGRRANRAEFTHPHRTLGGRRQGVKSESADRQLSRHRDGRGWADSSGSGSHDSRLSGGFCDRRSGKSCLVAVGVSSGTQHGESQDTTSRPRRGMNPVRADQSSVGGGIKTTHSDNSAVPSRPTRTGASGIDLHQLPTLGCKWLLPQATGASIPVPSGSYLRSCCCPRSAGQRGRELLPPGLSAHSLPGREFRERVLELPPRFANHEFHVPRFF